MIKVYQTDLTADNGNCLQASIASVLELPLECVPHFVPDNTWQAQYGKWLRERNMAWITLTPNLDVDAGYDEQLYPGYTLFGVKSRKYPGGIHSVVAYNGTVVHDPNPGNDIVKTPYAREDVIDVTYFVVFDAGRMPMVAL